MKVNTRSGFYAGKTNNCHLEASHTHSHDSVTANIEIMTRMSESLNGFTNVLNGTGRRRKQTCPGKSSLAFDKENSAN